jgi:hypothetical protein
MVAVIGDASAKESLFDQMNCILGVSTHTAVKDIAVYRSPNCAICEVSIRSNHAMGSSKDFCALRCHFQPIVPDLN